MLRQLFQNIEWRKHPPKRCWKTLCYWDKAKLKIGKLDHVQVHRVRFCDWTYADLSRRPQRQLSQEPLSLFHHPLLWTSAPPPSPRPQTQPSFFHFRCSNHFLEEAIPGRSSVELSLPLLNPPSASHHPAILALCISFFFFPGIYLPSPTNQQRIDAYCA